MTSASAKLYVPAPLGLRLLRKVLEILFGRLPAGRWVASIPGFRDFYSARVLARRDHTGLHSGLYRSFDEASAAIPQSRLAGWDHDESAGLWDETVDPVRPSTYPVFFWLGKLLAPGDRLLDLGGSVGLTYYGYRRYSRLPADCRWTVVEMPKIAAQGRRIAEREQAAGLDFLDDLALAPAADILLAAGALQFMEHSVPGLLERLPNRPRYLILNKLPVYDREDAWTLHNYGPAVTPNRLYNDRNFIRYFEQGGYRVLDRWAVQDLDIVIPFHADHFIREFSGFVFERTDLRSAIAMTPETGP